MDRRRFLLTSLAGALAAPLAAEAQSAGRIWRIGYLSLVSGELEQYKPWLAAFRDGLRELGYVEGKNVIIEQRYAAGQIERLPALAAELVRLKVDILVAAPAGSALAAKKVTSTVPIVFMGEPDPVGTGLVASLARPGGTPRAWRMLTRISSRNGSNSSNNSCHRPLVSASCGIRPTPAPRHSSRVSRPSLQRWG